MVDEYITDPSMIDDVFNVQYIKEKTNGIKTVIYNQ